MYERSVLSLSFTIIGQKLRHNVTNATIIVAMKNPLCPLSPNSDVSSAIVKENPTQKRARVEKISNEKKVQKSQYRYETKPNA
jgi:hypothetical protein